MNLNLDNRRTLIKSLNIDGFEIAAEVGVSYGDFSKFILDNTKMKLYSIDPWEVNEELSSPESAFASSKEKLQPFGDRSEMVKGYSPAAAAPFSDAYFCFVYIDGLHDYESVKKDIVAWYPKVREGGVIAGHDFNRTKWPGVCQAVDEFCKENGLEYELVGALGRRDGSEFDGNELSWVIKK